jgi:hypothetical protein
MNPERTMIVYRWFLLLIPRLAPILISIVGWRFWGWPGAIIGFAIGCLVWFALWLIGYWFFAKARLKDRRQKMSVLSTEELKKLAVDPLCREMALAMMELDRRGFKNIRPPVESFLELLTSNNPNLRALGFSQLFAMYPSTFQKIANKDSSSTDSPEVWRERIAALGGKY